LFASDSRRDTFARGERGKRKDRPPHRGAPAPARAAHGGRGEGAVRHERPPRPDKRAART